MTIKKASEIFKIDEKIIRKSIDDGMLLKQKVGRNIEIPDDTKTIVVPSDEYYKIVENICKTAIESENYSITQISLLRQPYYHIECKTITDNDDSVKADALLITETIYNELLKYEYKRSLNIFASSHTIISITFYGVSNDNKNTGLCLQFDILDVDRNKSFEENLKTPIAP